LTELRFYFDENIDPVIASQLLRRGMDAVSVHSLDLTGDTDISHLERATEMNRVLCTYDADFFHLNNTGIEHAGIFYAIQDRSTIGGGYAS
jgi:predicted nuclease of predicted toxin-antitoxin system